MFNIKSKWFFLWCFVISGVLGDTILRQIQARPELYSKMKKVWYVFVKTFIKEKALRKITSLTDFKKSLLYLTKLSGTLIQMIDRNVDVRINKTHPTHVQTVKWAFGKINFSFGAPFRCDESLSSPFHEPCSYYNNLSYCGVFVTITFDMHYLYQLNLTFYELSFSSSICYLGALRIGQYEFCGFHSLFNFYPQENLLFIKCSCREGESVILHLGFTVFDKEIVSSAIEKYFYFESILPSIFHKFVSSENFQFLKIYFIRTKVTSKLKLNFILQVNVQYLVHDGPSVSFHPRRVMHNSYMTSTHQCTLQALQIPQLLNVKNQIANFSFTSTPLNFSTVHLWEHSRIDSVSLPSEWCQQSHCLIRLQSQHNTLQVNITILKITSEITHNQKCIYGGLVIGEQMHDNQQEYQTLCESHNGQKTLSKSVYSTNSSLFIALYWYNKTGRITTLISISQTPCKPLYIDDCRILAFYGKERNESRCLSFLNTITAHTDVRFKQCRNWMTRCTLHLSSIGKTSCTILQFIRKDPVGYTSLLKWPNVCKTRLIIDLFFDLFTEARYEVKMSFGPLPSLWKNPKCHDKMGFQRYRIKIVIVNEPVVVQFPIWNRSPITPVLLSSIHRQRHSWVEMILNISNHSCVLQLSNPRPLLFFKMNKRRTEVKCPKKTLIMRTPKELRNNKRFLLEIYIKAHQGLELENPGKEMMYWFYDRQKYEIDGQEIIFLKVLRWVSIIKPSDYTVITLPGKMYSFEIKIMNKSELIELIDYNFCYIVNELDSKLLDFIWLDESPTQTLEVDSQISPCNDTPLNLNISQCLNFSQMVNLHKEYYIFSTYTNNSDGIYSTLKSWDEASALCESINGQLPYFSSSDELGEIIKIMRLSSVVPPIEIIFIGLWFNTRMVCAH